MEIENPLNITNRQDLRNWLEVHSTMESFCWVIVSRIEGTAAVQYLDIVEEALCFCWIDGIKKKISDTESAQRLSPRKKRSNWTELNKERARRLIKLGLMNEPGLSVLPDMRPESFIIHQEIETRLKEDDQVYQNFLSFPELYRRIRIDTIQAYKNDSVLFNRRLDKFIENTSANKL
ncbi:YdeI/OmpD-associated family protein [Carnobacterium jeotgali]|uniref:YdeI/OmpD-associated family protein n=1 Tax=Carnobacterium jeotgali TaxID=545534 RepID=UPI003C77744A